MSAQAGAGVFVSPRLAHCVTNFILLGGRFCFFKLRLQERSLCILQVYAPNDFLDKVPKYQPFLDKVGVALKKVTSAESIVVLRDFNAHVGTDDKARKGFNWKTKRLQH